MSSRDAARQTKVEISFAGVDITDSIGPYLLSVTYTDNEEDETDDLQIRLQDRDGLWLTKWLNDAIDAAASTGAPELAAGEVADSGLTHTVVKGDTLWDLSEKYLGSGSRYMEIYELNTAIIADPHWIYPGQVLKIPDGKSGGENGAAPDSTKTGLKIQAVFVRKNWNGDGADLVLDSGQFELDSVDASGPPSVITMKATSLPYSAQIRQTEKSRAWEAYTLSGIANEMARNAGMACMYESASDVYYQRAEQYKTSDIAFLSSLCHNAGISLKATGNMVVLFDQAAYEANETVLTIRRGSGDYTKYKLLAGTAGTEYASCRVSYADPATGQCIEAVAYVEDYDAAAKNNQQLEVTAKVSSIGEAKALAEKRLRLHNKYSKTASFTLPGNPNLVAGLTVLLEGWGSWSGKYIISQAKHIFSASGGYTVQVKLRRVLEGY